MNINEMAKTMTRSEFMNWYEDFSEQLCPVSFNIEQTTITDEERCKKYNGNCIDCIEEAIKNIKFVDGIKLKGEIKLGQHTTNKDDYWIYDNDGLICGSLGINEDKVKELIKRANKEIPMEVIKIKGVSSQACPVCKYNVNWNYCSNCGQRIKY
jgi:hypothetical protein